MSPPRIQNDPPGYQYDPIKISILSHQEFKMIPLKIQNDSTKNSKWTFL